MFIFLLQIEFWPLLAFDKNEQGLKTLDKFLIFIGQGESTQVNLSIGYCA